MIGGIPGIGEKPYYAPGLWRPDSRCPIPDICFALLRCEFGSGNIRDWRSGLSAVLPSQITWVGDGLNNDTSGWFACYPPSPIICGSSHTWIARFSYSSIAGNGLYLFDQQSPRCIIAVKSANSNPATLGIYSGTAWTTGPQLPSDWHTLALVADGVRSIARFYIDGTFAGSGAMSPISMAGGTQNWFNRYASGDVSALTGRLQWAQVFYSALTDAQIAAQYRDPFMWLRSPSNRLYSIPSGAIRVPWHLFTPVAGGA